MGIYSTQVLHVPLGFQALLLGVIGGHWGTLGPLVFLDTPIPFDKKGGMLLFYNPLGLGKGDGDSLGLGKLDGRFPLVRPTPLGFVLHFSHTNSNVTFLKHPIIREKQTKILGEVVEPAY